MTPPESAIARVMRETGMGELQARRHVEAREIIKARMGYRNWMVK